MAEKPILFKVPMVQAILSGRKSMTRRIMNPQPQYFEQQPHWRWKRNKGCKMGPFACESGDRPGIWGKYVPGDILWVKETWARSRNNYLYAANCVVSEGPQGNTDEWDWDDSIPNHWRPSIFMPRLASRISLEVTAVRIERLHEITEDDAVAEGFSTKTFRDGRGIESAVFGFRSLWHTINGKTSWEANPWLWVVSFKVLSTQPLVTA